MGKMAENPRNRVFSIRLNDEESTAVDKLTTDEARAALVRASVEKGARCDPL